MTLSKRLPYPGLRAFTREESDLFFGREGAVDTMVDCLTANRFMAVLGPSGGGKSSLVRTGLLDALEMGLLTSAGSQWKIADLHPGGQPIRKLATALLYARGGAAADATEVQLMTSFLRQGPRSVVEWASAGNIQPGYNLLLLVDQFEELFRYADYAQREEAEAFVAMILESSFTRDVPIYVVLTMRSEYLGACASIQGLAERISTGLYLTPRMDRDQCREAIEGPAGVIGFKVEGALVNRLLNDLGSFAPWQVSEGSDLAAQLARQADQLPLMQHVLNRLWLRADREANGGPVELKLEEYERLGGLSGALDAHGAEVMAELGGQRLKQIESTFRALVSGSSAATAVRRPCRMRELVDAAGGSRDDVVAIVEAFRAPGCNFLRTSDASLENDAAIVDISHESLIRQWTPLREWLEKETRDSAAWRRLLSAEERYRLHEGGLLTGLDYQSASAWWGTAHPIAAWASRHGGRYEEIKQFLETSRLAGAEQADAERRRELREHARLRLGVAGLAIALAIASGFGFLAHLRGKTLQEDKKRLLVERSEAQTAEERATTAEKNESKQLDEAKRERDRAQRAEQQADNAKRVGLQMSQQKHEAELEMVMAQASEAEARAAKLKSDAERAKSDDERVKAEAERDEARRQRDEMAKGQVNQDVQLGSLGAVRTDLSQAGSGKDNVPTVGGTDATALPSTAPAGSTEDLSTVRPGRGHNRPQGLIPSCETRTTLASSKDESKRGDDQFRRAVSIEESGDAFSALGLYSGAYCDYLSVLDARSGGEAPDPELAASFVEAGYFYAWYLFDFHQDDEGSRALAKMNQVTSRFDPQTAPPPMLRAMAALENLKSRRAAELKKPDIEYLRNAVRLGLRALAEDESLETMRFLFRFYQNYAADNATPKNEQADFKNKACELADRMFQKNPEYKYAVRARVECLRDQSDSAVVRKEPDAAQTKLDAAHDLVRNALRSRPKDQDLLMVAAAIEVDAADLVFQKKDGTAASQNEHKVSAEKYFAKALDKRPRLENFPGEVKSLYVGFRSVTFGEGKSEEELKFFKDVAAAVGKCVEQFPEVESFEYVLADASSHVGALLAKQSPPHANEAERYLTQSVDAFSRSGVLDRTANFSEDFANYCGAYRARAEFYSKAGRADQMLADIKKMKDECTPVLDQYPFDIYLRFHFLDSAEFAGKTLLDLHRYDDALEKLTYASKWGVGASSKLLASMYREGLGVTPDEKRAKELDEQASGQTMKRYTITADFAGVKAPFNFYVREWPQEYVNSFPGIKDQVEWLQKARGGTVSKEVIDSFDKLQKIAHDNKVSFPELCEYALSEANKDKVASKEEKNGKTASLDSTVADAANRAPSEKAKPQYDQAVHLLKQGKVPESLEAAETALSLDPQSTDVLALAEYLYHDKLFQFDRAFDLNARRVELGVGGEDFVEKHLTTARFEACAAMAAVLRGASTEKRIRLVMSSLEFACLSGEHNSDAALVAGRQLRKEMIGLQKVNWTFTGTEHFISGSPAFAVNASQWVNLFEALSKGDEKKGLEAMTALGVPE
jgi:uncharacterized protein YfcZ (UPF0381/DUF406 family)